MITVMRVICATITGLNLSWAYLAIDDGNETMAKIYLSAATAFALLTGIVIGL